MESADKPPTRVADQPSEDDGPDSEELVEDQRYFDKLLVHLQSFLPFLTKVIDSRELLEIQPDHVSKLQCLYELVEGKRLSPDRLKTCRKVFYDLYDSYSSPLNYYLPQDFKTSWIKETKLNDNEQKISSKVDCTFNKSNQNQNSKSELSNSISVPSTSHDKMVINQPDSLDDLTPNNENTIDKNLENIKISDSSSSKNLLNDSMSKKNDLPEFSDSRLRLNKIIGFAANASIEKLNKSDASIPHTELTTQIFNEIIEQNNGPVLYKDMLKGINIDDIDVNYVKDVIEGIKKASCVEPVQPPPLPPSDLMDLGASRVNLISSTESNSNAIVTHDNILLSKFTTTSRAQTNTDIHKLHKTDTSNDIRQKFISALKPGTLIDLENSKVSRTSLHIESLRPVIKANEKSNDFITTVADVSVPRDPRIRNKSLLNSENSVSQINTHPSLISNIQNTFSTNIPTLFASNIDNSNTTLYETRAQEMSGYNDPSLPNHSNIKLSNQPFFSEHNGGNSIHFKNRPQNQNRRNDHQKNDFNQFSSSTQMHVITPSHNEPMVKYCEPVPYKSHTNDIVSKRDPRSLKNNSVINRVQFRNYKEYREAKYGKEQKSIEKNKQMNHVYEKIEKNNIINSSYNTFGIVNETANIKSFKIPKIKHNEDLIDNSTIKRDSKPKTSESNKNNADVLKAENNSKIVKKNDIIIKQHIEDDQKIEIKKSNDPKKTDKINIDLTDKNIEIEITENSNVDEDLKMKIMVNNNSEKKEKCPETNFEKITVNLPSEINKDELDSKSEQNNILIEPIKHKKPKKPKKYSKEKEFEKIVKEAVESSYDNECGPRTRTRCSLLKKDETLKTSKVNSSKSELKKNSPSKNNKKLESGECSKNLDNVSIPNMKDDIKPIEIGHNIISSTSKEQSEVVNSTTIEILSRSQEENLVSSNEINSTADNPKIDEKVLIDILKNPKFMTVISIFQDENKMEKLNKLLESSDVNSSNDQLKNKDILAEEQLNIDKQKKLKRKMKKEKKKRKKMKKNLSEESSNEESINDISDDNNLNQAENVVITKKKNDTLNELNKGNINSGNVNDHSSDQHKLKSVKRKKSKETYGNFEILKDKCKPELKDLKIVLAKFDKNIKRSENCNLGISSTNNDILTNNKPINTEKAQEIKPKKPFLGPLSVKLARQKMEIEQNNSKSKQYVKNKLKFETKSGGKGLKSTNFYDRNTKFISKTLTSLMIEQPIVVLSPLPDLKPFEEIISNKSAVQNQNTSTVIEPNVNVNKPEFKKARLSELDKLHADISEMFDCEAVLNASNIRQCRTNKQIDYVNTNIVLSKKKKSSNNERVDSNDDQIESICGVKKPKATKNKVKKSTLKLNKKKKYSKQSMANKTLSPVIVKTAVLNKMSNKQPNKFKKKKRGNKKFKKSSCNQLNNSINNVILNDESQLNDVSNNVISTEIMPKVLSENDFKDKSYFQTSDNILECKFCNYKDKGLNIVRHYKNQHCREEVLPSRLSKNCIESLIHQSIKENFGYQNSQDSKTFCLGSVNDNYTCVFCQVIFHDYFKFHDHITSHTGEYRFKCKMCDHIYPNKDELDTHILEHTDYDRTNGISHLVYPNPIWSKVVFGYLCSFCYYVQLDYNNITKHMASRHFYEDKKLNSHWTVIRISMSMPDENYIDPSISFDTLEGCLPPIEADQVISKNNEDQNQSLTVRDLIIQSKKQIQSDSISSIKKECVEQNIKEILPETIIDENLSEIPIFENLPDLTIDNNSAQSSIDKNSPELNNDENLPHLYIDKNSAKSSIDKNLPELNNDENLPESVIDLKPPESNMLTYLPEQDYQDETRISKEESDITNSEYTLKENSTKCVLAGLSCELINSMLLFKCSVSSCLENQFSTVIFNDFYKHINQNHRFVVWDGKCEACHHNFKLVSEQYYVKNAFEHLVSHHLVLKSNEQSNPIINLEGSKVDQSLSSSCIEMAKNTPIIVEKSLRVRCLPGDTLSIREASMTNEEKTNLFEDNRVFVLRNDLTQGIIGNISCKKINNKLLFQCIDESCPNTCSTIFYNEFVKHIQSYHKITSWNGMCNICGSGFWRNFNSLFMENALEHLVSHHLLECQKNVYSAHKPSNSSISKSNICEMSVNKSPSNHSNSINKNVNLSINHGSNDGSFPLLSSRNGDVKSLKVKINTFKMNSSASDNDDLNMWMKTKTNCELVLPNSEIFLEAGQQIVNNGIPIDGTIYLIDTAYRKDYDKKVRDLPMNVMKTKLAFNEMSALPRLLGLFKCMDRTCTKIFNSKELFKLHMKLHFSNTEKKKKNQIYNVEQFKMCAYCFKMFDDEESLTNHIVDKYTFCEYFCPYCFYRAYTASHVLVHQSVIHTKISKHLIIKLEYNDGACNYPKETLSVVDFKEFVLPYKCNVGCCAFSCYLHNEFTVHLNEEHQQCDKFCCYICANKDDGEGFFALHPSSMITHFKLHNLNKYQCIFCLFGSEIIDSMIKHLAFEHFEYDPLCLERSTVSDNCDSKNIKNLKILRLKKVVENGIIEVVNLPADTISLPEVLPQKSKKRSIECSDVLSVAMKSARIDEESQPSDTIVITVPDRAQMTESSTSLPLSIDNEFIMIDDVKQNDMQESLKIDYIWSESKNKEKEPKVSSNDDIIVIDDEDEVDLLEKKGLDNSTKQVCLEREESTNGSIKPKRLAFPIIELDKLFVCKECEKIFSNGDIYFAHLNECPFWDSAAGQKCMYCVKVFKTQMNMTEHVKLHGPDRFNCSLCNMSVPSQRAIAHHMKHIHKITNLDFVPKHPNFTNLNKDDFIVFEDKTVEQKKQKINNLLTCNKCSFKGNTRKVIMSHMKDVHNTEENVDFEDNSYGNIMPDQPNYTNNSVNSLIPQQNTSLKRKRSTNFGNQKGSSKVKPIIKDKTKNLCFSPDTIDSIPKSHIFSDPIGCLLCTYNTKVRSNLIIHLNGHTKGQDNTTKEIVNPVPSIGKSELMFDKMINLSASSFDAMNTEKMKRDELDKKIVEVAPSDNFKTEIFPQFVPKNMRYKCSIPLCNYTGMTEEMLKSHISILHSTYQCYICPHCQPPCITSKTVERNQIEFHLMHHGENLYKCQYCEYIDFNRVEMRTHMRNTHLSEITNSVQSNIIVIRKTMLEDNSIDRGRNKVPSNVARWVCNICSTGMRYTENEITSHILIAHKVTNMFKCPMCQFENKDDNASTFEEHYKSQHPSVAVKCLRVFEMITDKEESHKQYLGGAENILEQQALESIEPTLVPPTCRGIPIDSTPLKINNKSRGMSKSPKSATKNSSIQSHKQKTLIDVFNKNDKLGTISSNGHFVCPKCYVFETINIELFREHLYKEVNYKTWKCLKCFEISDSPKKMAWHVKKHGIGSKYEKIEDSEKLKWVDRVIGHQHLLLTEFNKNSKAKHVKSVESNKTVIVNNKRTSYSPIKKKNTEREKKLVLVPQLSPDPVSNDDIINLVDDSDDE